MEELRPDDLARQVAAWHNRHPLACRIKPAQVQGLGWVALPFVVKPGVAAVEGAAGAGRASARPAAQELPVLTDVAPAPAARLRDRMRDRVRDRLRHGRGSGAARAMAAAGRTASHRLLAQLEAWLAAERQGWVRSRTLRPALGEDFIAPAISPRQAARWALRHGLMQADTAGQPLRNVLLAPPWSHQQDAPVQRLFVPTAAVELGSRRVRLLLAPNGAVCGPRLLSPQRTALATAPLLAAVLALVLPHHAPWPGPGEGDAVAVASAPLASATAPASSAAPPAATGASVPGRTPDARPGLPPAGLADPSAPAQASAAASSMPSEPAARSGADRPAGLEGGAAGGSVADGGAADGGVAHAGAGVGPPAPLPSVSGDAPADRPLAAPAGALAATPLQTQPGSAWPAADTAASAPAGLALARQGLPPDDPPPDEPAPKIVISPVPAVVQPLNQEAKVAARQAVADARAAAGLPPRPDLPPPSAAGRAVGLAQLAMANPAAAAGGLAAAPDLPPVWALSSRVMRTRAESELVKSAVSSLLAQHTREPLLVELMPVGDDWRVVCWPFLRREDAQIARALLLTRGLRMEPVEF